MNAVARAPALDEVARGITRGVTSVQDLHAAFLAATVYCERGPQPGFLALGAPGRGVIPVFTSPLQLALARGAVGWFSLSGADLLDLLPAGYDLLLDLGCPTPLRLRPAAIGRPAVFEVVREET